MMDDGCDSATNSGIGFSSTWPPTEVMMCVSGGKGLGMLGSSVGGNMADSSFFTVVSASGFLETVVSESSSSVLEERFSVVNCFLVALAASATELSFVFHFLCVMTISLASK